MPLALPSTAARASHLQHATLANGLRIYLQEDHRAPLVSVQLSLHVGASHEPAGNSGLSHALEHLVFDGSSKLAQGEYISFMNRLGASPNAFTDSDNTYFPLTLPASRLEIALEALADITFRPTLEASAFTKVLEIVKAERRSHVEGTALGRALEAHKTFCYGNGAYATPVIGRPEDLDALTIDTARDWHRHWYHPNNATLVVVGATDMPRLRELVERHFGAFEAAELPPLKPLERTAASGRRTQTLRLKGLTEGLLMSFGVPSLATAPSNEEACALQLLPKLLGKGASAFLRQRLLSDELILLNLSVDYDAFKRADSLLEIRAHTNTSIGTPAQALDRIMQEIATLHRTPFTERDLNRAKVQFMSNKVFARDDIANQAETIRRYAVCGLDPHLLEQERQTLEAVTVEQVRQVASLYLTEDRLMATFMLEETNDE